MRVSGMSWDPMHACPFQQSISGALTLFLELETNPGCLQFLYVMLVGSFPFNSFLSGFFCSLGFFVLMGTYLWSLCTLP